MTEYTQDSLQEMKFGQLVKIAAKEGVYRAGMTREDVVKAIIEPQGADDSNLEESKPKATVKSKATPKSKTTAKPKKAESKEKGEKKERKPRQKKEPKTIEEHIEESGVNKKTVQKILDNEETTHSDKIRALFIAGVKIPRAVTALTGRHYSFVYEVLCKQRAVSVFDALHANFADRCKDKGIADLSTDQLTEIHKEQVEIHKATYVEFGLGDNRQSDIFTDADYKRVGKNAAEKTIEKIIVVPEVKEGEEAKLLTHKEMESLIAVFYGK